MKYLINRLGYMPTTVSGVDSIEITPSGVAIIWGECGNVLATFAPGEWTTIVKK